MFKDYTLFETKSAWREAGDPLDSYWLVKSDFDIACKRCGGKAVIYHIYESKYEQQNTIKCEKCDNEIELYGVDG